MYPAGLGELITDICREACPILLKRMEQCRLHDPTSYAATSLHGSSRKLQQSILQALAEVWEPLQPDGALIARIATACLPYLHIKTPEDLTVS